MTFVPLYGINTLAGKPFDWQAQAETVMDPGAVPGVSTNFVCTARTLVHLGKYARASALRSDCESISVRLRPNETIERSTGWWDTSGDEIGFDRRVEAESYLPADARQHQNVTANNNVAVRDLAIAA